MKWGLKGIHICGVTESVQWKTQHWKGQKETIISWCQRGKRKNKKRRKGDPQSLVHTRAIFWPLLPEESFSVCVLLQWLRVSFCWRHCRDSFPHVTTNQCCPRFSPAKAKWICHCHRPLMLDGWPLQLHHHDLEHLLHLHRTPSSSRPPRPWRPGWHLVKSKN